MNIKLKNIFIENKAGEEKLEKYEKVLGGFDENVQEFLAEILAQDVSNAQEFMKILDMKWEAISKKDSKMLDEVIEIEKKFIEKIEAGIK